MNNLYGLANSVVVVCLVMCVLVEDPDWVSYNLGIFICERCAGIHKSLGSHISKLKPINDNSWTEEELQVTSLYIIYYYYYYYYFYSYFLIIIIIFICYYFLPLISIIPREVKNFNEKKKSRYDLQSMQSSAGRTALKRCTNIEILWYRKLVSLTSLEFREILLPIFQLQTFHISRYISITLH